MNENENSPAKWLQYLLYVGIAATANYLLTAVLPGRLSGWIGYALSAATVYLFFRLIGANARYKTAALFAGASVIIRILGIPALSLAASICAIVGMYQEYYAHSELIRERDPSLAEKWSSLFWFQLAVELIGGIAVSLIAALVAASAKPDSVPVAAIATVAVAFITPVLKVLYLVYLNRTIKAVSDEFVV